MIPSAMSRMTRITMRRRVRFLRSSASRSEGGSPPSGTAMVRPVDAAIIVVAAAPAPAAPMTLVRFGSPASTGRPSAKRRRSARSSSAEA